MNGMASSILRELSTGILFRNAAPHLRSVHAYFPSVTAAANGDLLASYMVGEAFEAVNCRVHLSRSGDGGATWEARGPITRDLEGRLCSESARITATREGQVVVLLHRHDRSRHPDEGLANPDTLGFVPTEFALARSVDFGTTWSEPEPIAPPLVGPSFELCAPITILRNGRWLLPTSTWADWHGNAPSGNRMVAFASDDEGRAWPTYLDVMHHPSDAVRYWESKIVELPDDSLLAVAWGYDQAAARDLPNQFALSRDAGRTWSQPASTHLIGQTMTPHVLDDGRVLCVYRRIDQPGLWAQLARVENGRWINEGTEPLWGHQAAGLTSADKSMVKNFQVLRFGAPCITRLTDQSLLVAFWCYEDCVGLIRWFRFRVA